MRGFYVSSWLFIAVVVTACGDPTSDAVVAVASMMDGDAPTQSPMDGPVGGPVVDAAVVADPCTAEGFVAESSAFAEVIPGRLRLLSPGEPGSRLEVSLRFGGVFGGPTGPGTYGLDGQRFDDCETCVIARRGCDDAGVCDQVFFANTGTLEILQWDAAGFRAQIVGARLAEMDVDNPIRVVPKRDGETWCLDGVEVSGMPLPAASGPIVPAQACVPEGTGAHLGHNIADFTLPNCLGEAVSIQGRCGETRALWLMASTGWCTACTTKLRQLAMAHGGALSRAVIGAQTPGLDMLVIVSEDAEGEAPTQAFCMEYAEYHGLDPAMVLLDYDPEGRAVPMIEPVGETHTFNAMATTWAHINPYLQKVQRGMSRGVVFEYPWSALLRGQNLEYVWSEYLDVGVFDSVRDGLLED